MESFASWLDRPFQPGLAKAQRRRGSRLVIIRCRGSVGRPAVRALIVLALLAAV